MRKKRKDRKDGTRWQSGVGKGCRKKSRCGRGSCLWCLREMKRGDRHFKSKVRRHGAGQEESEKNKSVGGSSEHQRPERERNSLGRDRRPKSKRIVVGGEGRVSEEYSLPKLQKISQSCRFMTGAARMQS